MNIEDVKLKKGMCKVEVNKLISKWLLLEDDVYMGNKHKHTWRHVCCKKHNVSVLTWDNARKRSHLECEDCKRLKIVNNYKTKIEKGNEYELIECYLKHETMPNGVKVKHSSYVKLLHKYCENEFFIQANQFIHNDVRCGQCCQKYENSFAYHIEQELGEPLEKYWDFEKNIFNPYHIYKSSKNKVWIKCQKKNYHKSYEISCNSFIRGSRCSYCKGNKVHPKDSFARYHIDNTDPNFLDKYWDWEKNTLNPWEITKNSMSNIFIKCQKKDYHNDNGGYEIRAGAFTDGNRCGYCKGSKIHKNDSIWSTHKELLNYWDFDKNELSPDKISHGSNKYIWLKCNKCNNKWSSKLYSLVNREEVCPRCAKTKGESSVAKWLDKNNVNYIYDEPYFQDLLSDKGNPLRPDFILPEHKIWIEYDGEFHYDPIYDDDKYKRLKIHDKRKDEYAKKHGWKMIRIPYWEFDNIEDILEKELKEIIDERD